MSESRQAKIALELLAIQRGYPWLHGVLVDDVTGARYEW